ncbi:MAG: hypothetical protein WEB37_10120 [Bacteroidota bacterium]
MITFIIVVVVIAGLIAGIVALIRGPRQSSGIAALTAFHDFQPKDKQRTIETVIELKEQKKFKEEESGWSIARPGKENDEL